jgi:hypothetical protein
MDNSMLSQFDLGKEDCIKSLKELYRNENILVLGDLIDQFEELVDNGFDIEKASAKVVENRTNSIED